MSDTLTNTRSLERARDLLKEFGDVTPEAIVMGFLECHAILSDRIVMEVRRADLTAKIDAEWDRYQTAHKDVAALLAANPNISAVDTDTWKRYRSLSDKAEVAYEEWNNLHNQLSALYQERRSA